MMAMAMAMAMDLGRRGWAVLLGSALFGGMAGCIQVPVEEELTLEVEDDDVVFHAVPRASPDEERVFRLPDPREPDYEAWPLSSDPRRARFGGREHRTYPLWPTPIAEPCPSVMFATVGPQLDGGDMFDRVSQRLASVEDPRLALVPTEISLLHDHVEVPGLRLVAASHTAGACMMGWSHTHCMVTHDDVYCPDGTTRDLERMVRAQHWVPRSLDAAAWFELAVLMSGVESVVIEPELVRECSYAPEASARDPAVEIDDERVEIRFTAITQGSGIDYTVIIERSGTVTLERSMRWEVREEEWG